MFALSETIKARMNDGLKTFCCFIDIRKAYDRVSRGGLWLHMWNMGIRGKAWRVIQDMYERVQSCVRVNGRKLEWFDINVGVRQGCVLSPILFSVFFNGLAKAVKDAGLGVPIGRGRKMALLLYADDIVLTARNASDLQKMITVVDEYSRKWRFDMNEDKTEVVVYGGADESGGEGEEYTVRSGKRLKVVHEYRYLGMEVGKGGGWSSFRKRLIARARARLNFAWTLGVHTGHTSVRTAVEIWRTMVCPILDWGAEIWPTDEVNKWAEAETMQKDVMRRILQCRSKTTTEAVRGELGWWTMKGRRTMLRLRYWGRLVRMDDDRLVKAVYLRARLRYEVLKEKNWCSYTHTLLKQVGLGSSWTSDDAEDEDGWNAKVKEKVHEHEQKRWKAGMATKTKLRTYTKVKTKLEQEEYLASEDEWGRVLMAQIRTGSSRLRIEEGRHSGLEAKERTCEVCNSGEVEDEEHFMLRCPAYDTERKSLRAAGPRAMTSITEALDGTMPSAEKTMIYMRRAWKIRSAAMAELRRRRDERKKAELRRKRCERNKVERRTG